MSLFLLNRTTAGAEAAVSAGSIPVRLPTFHARYTVINPAGNLHGSRFLPSASKKKKKAFITDTETCVTCRGWFQSYYLSFHWLFMCLVTCFSGQGTWLSVVAYDACVRLCLHSWARGCTEEAPLFLENECALLRNAFG